MNESRRVADALDAGLIPWRFPNFLPRHAASGKVFSVIDSLALNLAAEAIHVSSPWWATAGEFKELGNTPRLESLGVRILHCPETLHNFDLTTGNFVPPVLPASHPVEVFDEIVRKAGVNVEYVFNSTCKYVGARDRIVLPKKMLFDLGPGGPTGWADSLAHELAHWSQKRIDWHSTSLIDEMFAEMSSGILLAALCIKPLAPNVGTRHHKKHASRWADLLRKKAEVLLEICDNVTKAVDLLLEHTGHRIARHYFKVTVNRYCRPRGKHRPSILSVSADGTLIGKLLRETGEPWKVHRSVTEKKDLGSFATKEDALTALLTDEGIDNRTPVVDESNVVSIPVSFGAWADKRHFDFDSALYVGDAEDGVHFLPEEGPDGKWHTIVIASTSWGTSVLAIDGPQDRYVDACEAGLRAAVAWCIAGGIRPTNEEVEAIRADIHSRGDP